MAKQSEETPLDDWTDIIDAIELTVRDKPTGESTWPNWILQGLVERARYAPKPAHRPKTSAAEEFRIGYAVVLVDTCIRGLEKEGKPPKAARKEAAELI